MENSIKQYTTEQTKGRDRPRTVELAYITEQTKGRDRPRTVELAYNIPIIPLCSPVDGANGAPKTRSSNPSEFKSPAANAQPRLQYSSCKMTQIQRVKFASGYRRMLVTIMTCSLPEVVSVSVSENVLSALQLLELGTVCHLMLRHLKGHSGAD